MKILCGLLALSLSMSSVAKASTDPVADNLAKDFESTKKRLDDAELKQRQVLSALYQLNKKIKKLVTDKGELSQQKSFLEVNSKNLNLQIAELEQRSKAQKVLLSERLRAIYKLGGANIARFLFSSDSTVSLERNLKILGLVASRDLELIRNYRLDFESLEQKRKTLTKRLDTLKQVEAKLTLQEATLRKEQDLKAKFLDGIRKNKMFAMNKINDLREKSLQYNIDDAGVFDLLFKPSFADQKGSLPIPTTGLVTQKFGLIKGQDQPYTLSHKGVFISAAKGSPIRSVFGGKVSYAGAVPGFGMTLIIDHGDHYYSVYSHAQDLKVSLGDEINQQQVIASVGDAAVEKSSGLYFEIRHFSEPYDPQQWMKGL